VSKENKGLQNLQLLQEHCISLKTLEVYVHHQNSKALVQAGLHNHSTFVRETLSKVDGQLKAIPYLTEIIVRFYDRHPVPVVKQMMQRFGWVVLMGDKDIS
jgi:hypothetical protein